MFLNRQQDMCGATAIGDEDGAIQRRFLGASGVLIKLSAGNAGDAHDALLAFDDMLLHREQGSQYTSEKFQRLMADNGVTCSMSRLGNVWDNAAMESFLSSLKAERVGGKTYRMRSHAKADVFDYIERFYNPTQRHSTLVYLSPMNFERQAQVA